MTIVMGLDQHRAQITAEWIDTATCEIARTRVAPADRLAVRRFLERFENDVARAHHRVDRAPEGLGADAVANHRAMYLELRVHRIRRIPDRRPHTGIVRC